MLLCSDMKLFRFYLFYHGQIPEAQVEMEKYTVAFYCRLHFYVEPAVLINIAELSEGKISQPLHALPHYLFILFCLLLSVSINMTHCQAYSRSSDDIF